MDIYLVHSEYMGTHVYGTLEDPWIGKVLEWRWGHVLCVAPWIKVCVCDDMHICWS